MLPFQPLPQLSKQNGEMKLLVVPALLCTVLLITAVYSGPCQTTKDQVSALVALYNATNGNQWTSNKNWGNGDPCLHRWYGVDCNVQCEVIALFLPFNNLRGYIPANISTLTSLYGVNFADNNISGTIPPEAFSSLTNLFSIWISNNSLTGTIPPLNKLLDLNYIDLKLNKLTGTIPDVSALQNLDTLYLQQNKLTGTVPFTEKPNIRQFNISFNQFSCPLPSWCSAAPTGNGLCAPCINNF